MKRHVEYLKKLGACGDAVAYAETQPTMQAAWDNCNRSDWMLWLVKNAKAEAQIPDLPKILRLYACWCVRNTPLADGRKVWDLLTDPRSKNAVKVSERFANGDASRQELAAARDAAGDAWDAARAAAWDAAARAAAWDAWAAAAWAADAWAAAAWAAAWDAAWDAARAAAWDAARAAAWDAAGDAQADQLRLVIPQFTME